MVESVTDNHCQKFFWSVIKSVCRAWTILIQFMHHFFFFLIPWLSQACGFIMEYSCVMYILLDFVCFGSL